MSFFSIQVIKDILFNSVRQSNRSSSEPSGPEPMIETWFWHTSSEANRERITFPMLHFLEDWFKFSSTGKIKLKVLEVLLPFVPMYIICTFFFSFYIQVVYLVFIQHFGTPWQAITINDPFNNHCSQKVKHAVVCCLCTWSYFLSLAGLWR